MSMRLKGQETEVQIIKGGTKLKSVRATDHTVTWKVDRKTQGYLGETSDAVDDVFMGVEGKMTLHLEDQDALLFIDEIVTRARRQVTDFSVNILTTFRFPNGRTWRYLIPNVAFGNFSTNQAGRADYVTMTVDYGASEAKRV